MGIANKVLLLAILGALSYAHALNDLYTGTVTLDGRELVLYRCDIAKNRYTLLDTKGKNDSLIKQLPKELGTKGYKLTVEVIGEYEERDGKNYLVVDSLGDITPNKSCHLLDSSGLSP